MILQATVRFREGTFELRCERCAALRKGGDSYWPLTEEFWEPKITMTRCRACVREVKAQKRRAAYANDPQVRAKAVAAAREYYLSLDATERQIMLDKKREQRNRWEREWRAERAAARAEMGLEQSTAAERRAAKTEWMRRKRDSVREAEGRERYERKRAA